LTDKQTPATPFTAEEARAQAREAARGAARERSYLAHGADSVLEQIAVGYEREAASWRLYAEMIERLRARAADLVEERERMRGFAINPESLAKRIASTCFSNEYEGDPERIANAIRDYLYIGRNQDA
jgi:rubrerythrin